MHDDNKALYIVGLVNALLPGISDARLESMFVKVLFLLVDSVFSVSGRSLLQALSLSKSVSLLHTSSKYCNGAMGY